MSADYQANIHPGTAAGLLVHAAKVAVAEWEQFGGPDGDYCLDNIARTVEDTLAALVAHDMDRARRIVDLADDSTSTPSFAAWVLTHDEPFSDETYGAVRR
jgi:hypothetical protein